MKKSWKNLEGKFEDRQKQLSNVKCECGCGDFISIRSAKAKEKGTTKGYVKGHTWKGKKLPESVKEKLRENHANVSGVNNPNFGKGMYGENNPNWQGGKKSKFYCGSAQHGVYTKKDRFFRKSIIDRDNECVLCGNKTKLTCHHIEPWVESETLRFEPKNCVTLCKTCHPRADNKHHKERIKVMLLAYINSIY